MTMNIETKSVGGDVSIYLKFGWKHTEDKRGRHGPRRYTTHILARDKDMPNYRLVSALEAKYFSLASKKRTYEPMDPLLAIIAFLCLIFPFVIYTVVKSSQKKEIEKNNASLQRQMDKILEEAATLL